MSKRKSQLKSDGSLLFEYKWRPVTSKDEWCKRKSRGQVFGDAPWGYVVTIPYIPNENKELGSFGGYIVRCKKREGKLLLQVVKKGRGPKYWIRSFTTKKEANVSPKASKTKQYRIINITRA